MKIRLFTIPNMVTLGNLMCGSCATVAAMVYGDLVVAFWLIVAAAVCDFADGAVARLLDQYSKLGVQLDSLADMISFGFAPAAILFGMSADAESAFALSDPLIVVFRMSIFLMAAFSALRLARFNIDDSQLDEFRGLPTPANAIFCAGLGLIYQLDGVALPLEAITALALVMAYLLVSPVRMFSLKFHNLNWKENRVRYIFLIVALLTIITTALCFHYTYSIPLIIVIYVSISVLRWVKHGAKVD